MKNVYAVSDLHGCLSVYEKIKAKLNAEDIVYCLGDCGDRGAKPWETIVAVYLDPQFIYLKGNHEDMLIHAIDEWEALEHEKGDDYYLLQWNGGSKTFKQWKRAHMRNNWARAIRSLPTHAEYINQKGQHILLSHAGYTPGEDKEELPCDYDLMWDRSHFHDKWVAPENYYIVHGHTPVQHFLYPNEHHPYMLEYAHHKYDIDMGCVRCGYAALLNLDTFDVEYIEADEEVD